MQKSIFVYQNIYSTVGPRNTDKLKLHSNNNGVKLRTNHYRIRNLHKYCYGANPTKLFFFVNEDFFRSSILSLAVVQYTHFFPLLQTLKLNTENRKPGKMKVW